MNKEHCLAFNKMVDCYLNNQINNLFDLEENMKALNNFQAKIDELQEMKDLAQIEHNGIALTILRKYVMREKSGKLLMRNLIRQYYDLNDEQIKRYEKYTRPSGGYYVTNAMVLYRKGSNFVNLGSRYCASNLKSPSGESFVYEDLLRNSFLVLLLMNGILMQHCMELMVEKDGLFCLKIIFWIGVILVFCMIWRK